jgi:hypothetical protein
MFGFDKYLGKTHSSTGLDLIYNGVSLFENLAGIVVHACNLSYEENRDRKLLYKAGSGQKLETFCAK